MSFIKANKNVFCLLYFTNTEINTLRISNVRDCLELLQKTYKCKQREYGICRKISFLKN